MKIIVNKALALKAICKIFGHDSVHVHTDYDGKTMIITIHCLRCRRLTAERYLINLNDLYFEKEDNDGATGD